ncbi:MAG: lysostaphin resistance A-like protein [Saprospiraceae bacterium]
MFIEQGRKGNNQFYLYLLTILICITGFVSFQLYLLENITIKEADANQTLFIALLPFSIVIFLLLFNVSTLHRRPFASLFNTIERYRIKRFLVGFGVWFILLALGDLAYHYFLQGEYHFNLNWNKFGSLLLISISLFPIQTLAEELFFRSYILQGLGNIFNKAIYSIVLSSIFFMLMHIANPEVEKFGYSLMCLFYLISGIFLASITVLDDGVEQSHGIHTATNIYGAVLINYEGSALNTDSLWKINNPSGLIMVVLSFITMILYFIFSKKLYNLKKINSLFHEFILPKAEVKDQA